MSPPGLVNGVVGIVISAMIPFAAGLIMFVMGGCRAGRLRQSLDVKVRDTELTGFMERLHGRLTEAGFTPLGDEGNFVQSGEQSDPTTHTHADKGKLLTVDTETSHRGEATVHIKVQYGDIIICDTGESAYLKALLDYVSGARDELKVAATRIFQGISALLGGIVTVAGCYFLSFEQVQKYWFALFIVGASNTMLGIQAIRNIRRSQGRLKGQMESLFGVLLGVVGMAFALIPVIWAEILNLLNWLN